MRVHLQDAPPRDVELSAMYSFDDGLYVLQLALILVRERRVEAMLQQRPLIVNSSAWPRLTLSAFRAAAAPPPVISSALRISSAKSSLNASGVRRPSEAVCREL